MAQTVGLSIKLKVLEVDQAKTVCGRVKKKKGGLHTFVGEIAATQATTTTEFFPSRGDQDLTLRKLEECVMLSFKHAQLFLVYFVPLTLDSCLPGNSPSCSL